MNDPEKAAAVNLHDRLVAKSVAERQKLVDIDALESESARISGIPAGSNTVQRLFWRVINMFTQHHRAPAHHNSLPLANSDTIQMRLL